MALLTWRSINRTDVDPNPAPAAQEAVDPYAGLTFITQTFEVDSNGDAWDWETVTNGEDPAENVFQDHLQGGSYAPNESSGKVVFQVIAASQYRCEHTIQLALDWIDTNNRHNVASDQWYAFAYGVEFEGFDSEDASIDSFVEGSFDGSWINWMQGHNGSTDPFHMSFGWDSASSSAGIHYARRASDLTYRFEPIITGIAPNTRYNCVAAFNRDSGDETNVTDLVKIYDGSSVLQYESDGTGGTDLNPDPSNLLHGDNLYTKHGGYWVGLSGNNPSMKKCQIRFYINGYGQFTDSGGSEDPISAALIKMVT